MKYLLVTILSLIACQAQAWFHFEPFIGYNRGQQQANQLQGLGYGVRAGLDFNSLFLVADIGSNTVQQGTLNQVTYSDTGVTFGGKVRNYRIWYGMISSGSFSYNSGGTTVSEKGTGYKIGIGSEIGDKLNINLETRFYNFTETGTGAAITEIGTIGFLSLSWVL